MDEILTTTLRNAIRERLAQYALLVENADARSKAALAETEILRLATAWEHLLNEHVLDARGRCSCRRRWRRTRCQVWAVAHRALIGAEAPGRVATDRRGGRHAERAPVVI